MDIILGIGRIFTVSWYMHRSDGFKTLREAKKASGKGSTGPAGTLLAAGNRAMGRTPQAGGGYCGKYISVDSRTELLGYPNRAVQQIADTEYGHE